MKQLKTLRHQKLPPLSPSTSYPPYFSPAERDKIRSEAGPDSATDPRSTQHRHHHQCGVRLSDSPGGEPGRGAWEVFGLEGGHRRKTCVWSCAYSSGTDNRITGSG
ncbi:hypothetical protein RRG08_062434 [Elysia crispata]|uniref:Uncharacterized protein n=1 Tax=Elysia crispata TaxID=231223 RepID=A0AAE1CJA4_9GAST|nr:hypothetical protein RRG08_062434 [Elysia crispata]